MAKSLTPQMAAMADILYRALAEPIGALVACGPGEAHSVRQALYRARATASDPALAQLQIRMAPVELAAEGALVIVKGQPSRQPNGTPEALAP